MSNRYTIGQLALEAGVPVSTVRYYERCRLLREDARSRSNYRLYGQQSLARLRFVRSAQAAGFTLSDIRSLLDCREEDRDPCDKVQSLINTRLRRVDEELVRLKQAKALLTGWITDCRTVRRPGRCGVLDVLAASASPRNKTTDRT